MKEKTYHRLYNTFYAKSLILGTARTDKLTKLSPMTEATLSPREESTVVKVTMANY